MGLCASKITPQSDLSTLLQEFATAIRTQHTFYAKVLEGETFTKKIFDYHNQLEDTIYNIRKQCMVLLSTTSKPSLVEYLREYNALRFEYMNTLMEFKRHLNEQYIGQHLIIDNELLKSQSFRTFFTLLPDTNHPNSIDTFCLQEKKQRDSESLHGHMTGESHPIPIPSAKFNTCPHCGLNVSETSVKVLPTQSSESKQTTAGSSFILASRSPSAWQEESTTPGILHMQHPHAVPHAP